MQIELSNPKVKTDSEYWMESSAFWMKMYVQAKKELEEYDTPKHNTPNPELRIVDIRDIHKLRKEREL